VRWQSSYYVWTAKRWAVAFTCDLKKNKILLLEQKVLRPGVYRIRAWAFLCWHNLNSITWIAWKICATLSDKFRFRSTKPYSFKWLLYETISRRSTEMPLKKHVYGCGWGLLTPTDCNPAPLEHDSLCRNYTPKSGDSCQHSRQVLHWPSRTRSTTSCACKIDWPVKQSKKRSCRSMATTSFLKILLRLITNQKQPIVFGWT
jgi:hypothetical protein